MNKTYSKILSVLFLLAPLMSEAADFSAVAADGFLFEPGLAYSNGVLTQSGVPDIVTKVVSLEARVGYQTSGFKFGLSYLMGFGTSEQMGNKVDFKPTDMGVFLGYALPLSFQLFGGYLFSAKAKIQSSDTPADFSGTGTRLGIAYTGFPFGILMIEMISRTYSKYESTALSKPMKDSTVSLSLSYPFE